MNDWDCDVFGIGVILYFEFYSCNGEVEISSVSLFYFILMKKATEIQTLSLLFIVSIHTISSCKVRFH